MKLLSLFRSFNNVGVQGRTSFLDCRLLQIIIFFILLIILQLSVCGMNILLFGDSIDRQTVVEWCELQLRRQEILLQASSSTNRDRIIIDYREWGQEVLKYSSKVGGMAALYCELSYIYYPSSTTTSTEFVVKNYSLAFVQMFGSPAHGPYLNDINNRTDVYVDTIHRIPKALSLYYQNFSRFPDVLSIQFAYWDTQRYLRRKDADKMSKGHEVWDKIMIEFETNYRERIQQVQQLITEYYESPTKLPQKTLRKRPELILRTAVAAQSGGELIHDFNTVVRKLSCEYNLPLFDFHEDVWSSANYDYGEIKESQLFRDWIHPKQFYTALAGEKYLNFRYSNGWKFPNGSFTSGSSSSCAMTFSEPSDRWKDFSTLWKKKFMSFLRINRKGFDPETIVDDKDMIIQSKLSRLIPYAQSVLLIGFPKPQMKVHRLRSSISDVIAPTVEVSRYELYNNNKHILPLTSISSIYLYNQWNHSLHLIPLINPINRLEHMTANIGFFEALRLGIMDILLIDSNLEQEEILNAVPMGESLPYFGTGTNLIEFITSSHVEFAQLQENIEKTSISDPIHKELSGTSLTSIIYCCYEFQFRKVCSMEDLELVDKLPSLTPQSKKKPQEISSQFFSFFPPNNLLDEISLNLAHQRLKPFDVIQYHKDRNVYYLDAHYHRMPVNNMQELFKFVNDTDQIKKLYSLADLFIFSLKK